MGDSIRVMISEEEVNKKIQRLGERISGDFSGETVKMVGILKGASFFTCELAKRVTIPVYLDFMSVASYGNGTESSGEVIIKKDLDDSIEGQNVLIVEDIIDSGRTLNFLKQEFEKRGAKTVSICTLLDKPERRVVDVDIDYTGFEIPDEFVVGYGLDYAQRYRNLPYIGVIEFEQDD